MPANARGRAEEFGIPRICATVEELLRLDDIEIVVNLTIPNVHAAIDRQILEAGKHCWTEKPLATNLTDAKELVELAGRKGLYLGSAPDTFLGAAVQTARRLIDQGWIGKPIGPLATTSARVLSPGIRIRTSFTRRAVARCWIPRPTTLRTSSTLLVLSREWPAGPSLPSLSGPSQPTALRPEDQG